MSKMNDLAVTIEEYACQDMRVANLVKWSIGLFLNGVIKYDELPTEAKQAWDFYTEEQKMMKDYDEWEASTRFEHINGHAMPA